MLEAVSAKEFVHFSRIFSHPFFKEGELILKTLFVELFFFSWKPNCFSGSPQLDTYHFQVCNELLYLLSTDVPFRKSSQLVSPQFPLCSSRE